MWSRRCGVADACCCGSGTMFTILQSTSSSQSLNETHVGTVDKATSLFFQYSITTGTVVLLSGGWYGWYTGFTILSYFSRCLHKVPGSRLRYWTCRGQARHEGTPSEYLSKPVCSRYTKFFPQAHVECARATERSTRKRRARARTSTGDHVDGDLKWLRNKWTSLDRRC